MSNNRYAIRDVWYCPVCGWESWNIEDKGKLCSQFECDGVLSEHKKEEYEIQEI